MTQQFSQHIVTVAGCVILTASTLFAQSMSQKALSAPPMAQKQPQTFSNHGDTRTDDYFYLRYKEKPEVMKYLHDENAYTQSVMADTKSLQEKLFEEMKGRVKESDMSVPSRRKDYVYYSRVEAGKQYPMYLRKKFTDADNATAPEEVLLDLNILGAGKKFIRLGGLTVSADGSMLAYSLDTDGSRKFTPYFKNLQTGAIINDNMPIISGNIEWANDNKHVFYTTYDSTLRSNKIWRHVLGTPATTDVNVFEEKDALFDCGVGKSNDEQYLFIGTESKNTSEVYYLNASTPTAKFTLFAKRKKGLEYSIEHHGTSFYIVTNADNAVNFKLMVTPENKTAQANWKDVIPYNPNVRMNGVQPFEKFLMLTVREHGLAKIMIYNLAEKKISSIDFPEKACTVYPNGNSTFNTDVVRFSYQSLISPQAVYDYNVMTKERVLKKQYDVPNYDANKYQTDWIYATAKDGTKIPISIMYKKGTVLNGQNPTLLYGYGSYGISMDPTFSQTRFSLLDRGFVFAIAHIRGGGENGRPWYDEGKLKKKKNTFTDFIASAEHLIAQKYTSSNMLVIEGGSAGGLLMGAVVNMRPDLFKAVHAAVPFVDMMNTMLDASLPLTTSEYVEWGNPNVKADYTYMKSYSPYDNVAKKSYPHLLLTTGINDTQVPYWEPAKWAAKLRTLKTDDNILLLKTEMAVGHGGASGRYDALKDRAFEVAFFLKALGIKE